MINSYILTENGVSGLADGKPFSVSSSHVNYSLILTCIKEKRFEDIHNLVNILYSLEAYLVTPDISIDTNTGTLYYRGQAIHSGITDRIIKMKSEGFDVMPMALFLENMMSNPSQSAIDELYEFLEYSELPITEDGHFIAYKRVNNDMKSFHDNKTEHTLNQVVMMDRAAVNDDRTQTCSHGLHFCSHTYLSHYRGGQGKVLVLKINPKDVVSIPVDYNNAKGRACQYVPIAVLSDDDFAKVETQPIFNESVYYESDWYEDEPSDWEDDNADDMNNVDNDQIQLNQEQFEEGYHQGYKDGRTNGKRNTHFPSIQNLDGYNLGFKDGKGHKKKQY